MFDARVARDVLDGLIGDDRINANEINAAVVDGVVTLTGRVATPYEKWVAGEDAAAVGGVADVRNDIDVDASESRPEDSELAMAAAIALARNGLVPFGAVDVVALNGWITATGNVHHQVQRQAVDHTLRHVLGLRGWTNRVTVSRAPANDVSKRITASLQDHAGAAARSIEVRDDGGVVRLTGTVRSRAEMRAVERAAWDAPGVTTVINELSVTD
jgi:osmotically-inducible protein OsmY